MNEILARAASWSSVPYSQTGFHTNEYGTYRTDCSGFASMAWGLPGRPLDPHGGLNSVELAGISRQIDKNDLLPGDLLIDARGDHTARHVTIFVSWADPARGRYWTYEQCSGHGTIHRVVDYPYNGDAVGYRPYRRREG
ncbi:NlpC/P60 family protein [Lentzea sp. PSKA42]|uniref:NlpC/P60 family protein n=1 Tax=Lentzea indica TaxID=2604800 RepID=A0ABX1FPT7_9PSEU|nr:NlpC/P60 family protein [Lentzea indica]NKE61030.1 NlpC/P60 family protein [Lentzea indica]